MFKTLKSSAATLAMACALAAASTHAAEPARFDRFTYSGHSEEGVKPASGEFLNPILSGYHPDPSIVRVGADYYLVNSSFSHFPGIPIFHSKDLVNWVQIGNAIDRTTQLNFSGLAVSEGVFAPDISYHDGTYYIINTCIGWRGNYVITAKNPAGPWSDPVWLDFEGIDPSIFFDGDKAYVVNNGAPNEPARYDGHRAIWVQEFDYKTLKLVGPRTQIVNGGIDITKKPVWIEGPHMMKRGAYYYLYAAEGGTGDWHSEVVLRSDSVTGPFVPYDQNPILTQRDLPGNRPHPVTSAGHAMFVETQTGDWWSIFLATRPYKDGKYNIGRETFLLPLTWTEDGWPTILAPGKPIPFAVKKPNLPADPTPAVPENGDFQYVDEFNSPTLANTWIGVRNPPVPFYSLDKGALVLTSKAPIGDQNGVPAFLGRRQQHHIADISTTVTFTPQKDGDRAGLVALQNDDSFVFFGVTQINGKRVVALYSRDKAKTDTLVASAPIATGPLTLTYHQNGATLSFDYALKGKAKTLVPSLDATLLSTNRAGGFVGTVVGPYTYYQ